MTPRKEPEVRMNEIPKRPERVRAGADDDEHYAAALQFISFEHAVAKVAVEALRDLVEATRSHQDDTRNELRDACEALAAITASGWRP